MNNSSKRRLKVSLLFTAFLFLIISNLQAQQTQFVPIIKYPTNNYSTIAQAVCDTCPVAVGKPLVKDRPIKFGYTSGIEIPGIDLSSVPGIIAPNFYGGGSPEIKGLSKNVAGMTDTYAGSFFRTKTDSLYFRTGARGIAVTANGKIFTSSGTILPGASIVDNNVVYGLFSFNSTSARMPLFNNTSNTVFEQSNDQITVAGNEVDNSTKQIMYFAVHPDNENIIYASLRNPVTKDSQNLARRTSAGKWEVLDWKVGGVLPGKVWGALTVDHNGNLYIADSANHVIVKAAFDDNGEVKSWQIIAGTYGTPGFKNASNAQDALFNKPSGICIDKAGNIYIGDAGNNLIRKIDKSGVVTTYAGSESGKAGLDDDSDPLQATFNTPTAVAFNEQFQTLYVVDFNNRLIREINGDKNVSTLAGTPISFNPLKPEKFFKTVYFLAAKLNGDPDESLFQNPTGIAIDPSGYGIYVSSGNYIKYVSTFQAVFAITSAVKLHGEVRDTINPLLPYLPLGVVMNPNNGSFYGVPLMTWEPTIYTISVLNSQGPGLLNGVITLEVVGCPPVPDSVSVSDTITPKQLPYTWNGQTFKGPGNASATLKTPNGCDSVVLMNLSVTPAFNYNSEPYLLSYGQQINPIVPATAGSKVDTFSVSPALPTGLALNAQTGVITGTPKVYVANQVSPAIGPKTPNQYPAPWTLSAIWGADITQVKISDGNQKPIFENNSAFQSLQGSASPTPGTGTAGAYTDFSGLGAIKMYSNTPYSVHMSNTLSSQYVLSLNDNFPQYNFMNSYAVYIDYNRDGDFADAGEKVYISAAPQRDAHPEDFILNIPATATAGVTKMRVYCVEASTAPSTYFFNTSLGQSTRVVRTTSQALSFYPFYDSISTNGASDFSVHQLNYGEFEDYNIDVVSPVTQAYVVTGSNQLGTAQSTINLAINKPSTSTTDTTICSTELPYNWNGLKISQGGKDTAHLTNIYGVDSAAILNLTVKQATSSVINVANCGPYTFRGQVYTNSGDYIVHTTNAVGCDSSITFKFRQKATASQTDSTVIPSGLPFTWNDKTFQTAGTQSATLNNANAEGCDSTATLTLRVLYSVYYPSKNLLTINKTITPITPQIEGGYQSGGGYSISPTLPNGLNLDPNTGVISGLPTDTSSLKTYTITLNQDGAKQATFTLSVGAPSVSTTTIDNCGPYTWNGVTYDTTGTATYNTTNKAGFDSTATLILTVRNPSTSTTTLLKNPSDLPIIWNGDTIRTEGLYTVHLYNAVKCDSAATVNVVVSPKILYTSPQILHPGQAITAIAPQNLGGKVINYTISPTLVKGLQFNDTTGAITGTPSDTLIQPVTYTITATNKAGTNSTTLIVGVCKPVATSFSIDTCSQFVWNDSTYTESTTDTRTLTNRGGCDSVVTMHLNIKKASWGDTTTVTACGSYVWYEKTYDKTGIYTNILTNAVGCDSTLTLNLTVNYPSVNNLYANLNASDFPYTWRNKTFTAPGSDTVLFRNGNSVGCDSTVRMNVSISALLPDITYAVTDTTLYWEKRIERPIVMTNTGTPVPAMKLGERDTLVSFSNGPGDLIKAIKGPDGTYYARVIGNNNIFKLTSSGVWTVFAPFSGPMAMDKSGNLYVGLSSIPSQVRKITPDGAVSQLPNLPDLSGIQALAVDPQNNLIIYTQLLPEHQFVITRLNLSTNQIVQTPMNNPYFSFWPEEFKTDSKGNIYMYRNAGSNLVKIKPDGHMSSIGRDGASFEDPIVPGNGIDATISPIASMAIDSTNDNVYVMSNGRLLRVDTAENVTALTGPGRTFDQYKDQIFRVDNGKLSVVNSSSGILYTVNVYGVGSLPFMDNYGVNGVNNGTVNYTDFDKRIRLDSSGAIVGTPRAIYSSGNVGVRYADNKSTTYTIVAANQHGISTAPMVITTKGIYYKKEGFVTTSLPFVWRGRSFTAATDTATYYVPNKTLADDTMYLLHLVYEGAPVPIVKATGICTPGGTTLTANGAAKNAISFDGTTAGVIKYSAPGTKLGYFGYNTYYKPDGNPSSNPSSSFEVWIKPTSVSGTQYLLTRDTVKTNGFFFGYSIQNGKFVYEFTKGRAPFTDYRLASQDTIVSGQWTHVAASYYDSAMHIFINGKPEGTLQTNDGGFNSSLSGIYPDFYLAGLPGKFGYKGEMDELRLFYTRRNADSILATMNTILDPAREGLGLYYRFDGDISNGVPDVSLFGMTAAFLKPATSVPDTTAPINFASYNWMPGGATTKSIVVTPSSKTLYTVTVTDYKKAQGSDSLSVLPYTPPGVTAPPSITRTNGPSTCSVMISDSVLGKAIAVDNCSVLTVQRTGVPAGNLFPVGVTTITYTATNSTGTRSATQTVTITDNQKPVITSNGNQVVNNDKDVCGAAVKVSANATDNCSVGAPTGVRSDGLALSAVYPVGTTTITWNVSDANGNAALPVTQTVTVTDNQKPTVLTKNITVTLVNGTASITASQIDAGSKDNCGIKTMSVSKSTFQCGDYGDKTVTLTAVDINGNIGSNTAIVTIKGVAPLPSIAVSRTDKTLTGLDVKTIALGYGAQQLTLTASNTTSSASATTYKWSPATGLTSTNTATTVFKPTTAGAFVFTLTATNEFGCTATTTVTINVVDVRCGTSNDKVLVCHKTTSKSNTTTQICISPKDVATYLNSGDNLGRCSGTVASMNMKIATSTPEQAEIKGIEKELTVLATPNPTTNVFKLRITSNDQDTPATVRVLDVFGRSLNQFDKVAIGSTVTFGEGYLNGFYFAEVFQGTQRKVVKLIKAK